MRATLKKTVGIIHLWFGLAAGLVICIVALTGALYVFSDDIIQITERSFRNVPPQASPQLSSSQLVKIGVAERERFLGDKTLKQWDWQTLYRYSDAGKAAEFTSRHYDKPDMVIDIFINPYTGKILKTRNEYADPFWDTVVALHTNLMLGKAGGYIVDFATLILLVMLVTGIILWFPKSRKGIKQRFSFKWKPTFSWKRKNYDLHNVLGFYASWIVIFMVITGLSWAFSWMNSAVVFALGGEKERKEVIIKNNNKTIRDGSAIDRIYASVRSLDSNAVCYNMTVRDSAKPFEVYVRLTENWTPGNTYLFHPATGAFLSGRKYTDLTAGEKYSELTGDIHYGWVFGFPSKIATFFGCLVVASLPVTGFFIWWGRRKKSKPLKKRVTVAG